MQEIGDGPPAHHLVTLGLHGKDAGSMSAGDAQELGAPAAAASNRYACAGRLSGCCLSAAPAAAADLALQHPQIDDIDFGNFRCGISFCCIF